MQMPEIGDRVQIEPTAAHCPPSAVRSNVIADPHSGRFLPVAGEMAVWGPWHVERMRQGEIIVRTLKPRAPAPGEMLESAPLPPGATAVEVK